MIWAYMGPAEAVPELLIWRLALVPALAHLRLEETGRTQTGCSGKARSTRAFHLRALSSRKKRTRSSISRSTSSIRDREEECRPHALDRPRPESVIRSIRIDGELTIAGGRAHRQERQHLLAHRAVLMTVHPLMRRARAGRRAGDFGQEALSGTDTIAGLHIWPGIRNAR